MMENGLVIFDLSTMRIEGLNTQHCGAGSVRAQCGRARRRGARADSAAARAARGTAPHPARRTVHNASVRVDGAAGKAWLSRWTPPCTPSCPW